MQLQCNPKQLKCLMWESCTELVALKGLILHPLTGWDFLTERSLKAGSFLHKAAWLKAFKAVFSHVALDACAGLTVSSEIQVNWSWQMLADVALSVQLNVQVVCRGPIVLNLILYCGHAVLHIRDFHQEWKSTKTLPTSLKLRVDQNAIFKLIHFTAISSVLLFCFSIA